MADFSGSVQGRFVDDDDIVRTGRAMIELDDYDFMQVPIPTGLKQAWDDLRGESSSNLAEIRSKAAQAAESAGAASKSATAAKTSETNAASSKNVAASSASTAAGSASAAKTSETNASNSAAAAKSSEQAAAGSAAEAKTSASAAKQDADRAAAARTATENIANSTSWNGDKLTVNGKTSPSLTGPQGPPGPKGDPGASGASSWDAVTGKPTSFPPSSHRHTSSDISDASNDAGNPKFGGKVIKGRERDGKIFYYSSPTEGKELANKGYVDTVVAEEKARTVGMVWMVETENQAKAKETSCQKGDFIQVADTGNIYKVV